MACNSMLRQPLIIMAARGVRQYSGLLKLCYVVKRQLVIFFLRKILSLWVPFVLSLVHARIIDVSSDNDHSLEWPNHDALCPPMRC